MIAEEISSKNWNLYEDMIPREYARPALKGDYQALGVRILHRPCGAVVWKEPEDEEYGTLFSLYVAPEARRLGVGTELLRRMLEKTRAKNIPGLLFTYVFEGDRMGLSPFFDKYKVTMETETCPLGSVTIKEVLEAMVKKNIKESKADGIKLSDLRKQDYAVVDKWIYEHIHERLADYMTNGSWGYMSIKDGKVKTALLFSMEFVGTINLSFAFAAQGSEAKLPELMALAVSNLVRDYHADTVIEMLLVNEQSKKLYEGLFGDAPYEIDVVRGAVA